MNGGIEILETEIQKLLHDEPQDQECEGYVNTSALAAVIKNVAPGDEETIETEDTAGETEKTVQGKVHSYMVYFDTHTKTKLTIELLDNARVHGEKEILMETALQKAKDVTPNVSALHAKTQDQGKREGDDDTNTLEALDKNVAHEDEDTEDSEDKEEMKETVETVSKSLEKKKQGHILSVHARAAASHTKMPAKKGKATVMTMKLKQKQSSTRVTRNKKVETQRTKRDKHEKEYVVSEMAPVFECSNSGKQHETCVFALCQPCHDMAVNKDCVDCRQKLRLSGDPKYFTSTYLSKKLNRPKKCVGCQILFTNKKSSGKPV